MIVGLGLSVDGNELDQKSQQDINSIVGGFLGRQSIVTEIVPPTTGRSRSGKQYRITTGDQRRISIKRAHSKASDLTWELFHSDMRQLLRLPHYKVELRNGFPLQGWEGEDYVLIDWGMADRRLDLSYPQVRLCLQNDQSSLIQLGRVAAQNIVFAVGDRKTEHFIWDLDQNALFSIDHEIISIISDTIVYFKDELRSLYGKDWRASPSQLDRFKAGFVEVWERAELNADKICKFYTEHGLDGRGGFSARIVKGHSYFLQPLLS